MSMDFSRRQSLKVLAGAGLLSLMPLGMTSTQATQVLKHAFVFTRQGSVGNLFDQSLNKSIDISPIFIEHNNYESILSIADLPKGSLLIGLVSEAEKVLIDTVVQDRRGIIQTTARVYASVSGSRISELANLTAQAAITQSKTIAFEKAHDAEMTNASLISFYAYL
jgi:hypothetical protein